MLDDVTVGPTIFLIGKLAGQLVVLFVALGQVALKLINIFLLSITLTLTLSIAYIDHCLNCVKSKADCLFVCFCVFFCLKKKIVQLNSIKLKTERKILEKNFLCSVHKSECVHTRSSSRRSRSSCCCCCILFSRLYCLCTEDAYYGTRLWRWDDAELYECVISRNGLCG